MFGNKYFGPRYFGDAYFGAANDNAQIVSISGSAAGSSTVAGNLSQARRRRGGSGASARDVQIQYALRAQIEDEDAIVMSFITAFLSAQSANTQRTTQWPH